MPDISVIIPTYNRAQELAKTLEGLVRAEKGDLAIEFIVVDNGSTDQTKCVLDSFSDRLRMQCLFESRPGKSRALNTALERVELGNIVVFTDDDVDPSPEWLVAIASACERWPNHSVFGGRINIRFPVENVPKWAFDPYISPLAFAYHNYSNEECTYRPRYLPFGPNFWVRKAVFEGCRRFNEKIGPFATGVILGEDTLFLSGLLDDGYEIVYCPSAVVTHRVRLEMLKLSAIFRRAYQSGQGETHIYGLPGMALLRQNPAAWYLYRAGSIILYALKVLKPLIFSSKEQRPCNTAKMMRSLGYRVEAMRLANRVLAQRRERP